MVLATGGASPLAADKPMPVSKPPLRTSGAFALGVTLPEGVDDGPLPAPFAAWDHEVA